MEYDVFFYCVWKFIKDRMEMKEIYNFTSIPFTFDLSFFK